VKLRVDQRDRVAMPFDGAPEQVVERHAPG
jgi:hypothetical protein